MYRAITYLASVLLLISPPHPAAVAALADQEGRPNQPGAIGSRTASPQGLRPRVVEPQVTRPRPTEPETPRTRTVEPQTRAVEPLRRVPPQTTVPICEVPDVSGSTEDSVRLRMSKLRVNVRVSKKQVVGGRGTVIDQTPKPGARIACGYTLEILIAEPSKIIDRGGDGERGSRGSTSGSSSTDDVRGCEAPDFLGSGEDSAKLRLSKMKAKLIAVHKKEVPRGHGTVVDQSPKPGTPVPCPLSVELWIGVPQRIVEVPPEPTCTTTVPRLVGALESYANKAIPSYKLRVGRTQTQNSDRPPGTVLDQSPDAGSKVDCQTLVHLLIATPTPVPPIKDCEVPQLVRADVERAKALVEGAGLKFNVARGDGGLVSAQAPAAGTMLKCGSRVDVAVVEPVVVCRVPDISGIDLRQARQRLEDRNLILGNIRERPIDQRAGIVLEQSVRPESVVPCRSAIDVLVTSPVQCPPVPHLVGRDPKTAAALIERAGFQVGPVSSRPSDQPDGQILAQAPPAGSNAKCGTAIALWQAAAQPITVPDLRGRDRGGATNELTSVRLRLGEVAEQQSDAPEGTVIDQMPKPGAMVTAGTPVQVWFATVRPITVPDLRGRDRQEAAEVLSAARLRLGTIGERPADDAAGSVIDQMPRAGTIAAPGTPVQIWLAAPRPIAVPDLRGRDRNAAAESLTAARLRLGDVAERTSDATAGVVVDQMPRPGTTAVAGSPVQVWVAVPRPSTVPDVVGRDRNAAAEMLTAARLRLGDIGERQSDATAGIIIDQQPRAGTTATAGAPVQVWVAVPRPRYGSGCRGPRSKHRRRDVDGREAEARGDRRTAV